MKILDDFERQGAVWQKIKAHLEARLASLRASNDTPQDEAATNRLRGKISEVKLLLSLDASDPVVATEDEFKD